MHSYPIYCPTTDVKMSNGSRDKDKVPPNGILQCHSHFPKEDKEETAPTHPPVASHQLSNSPPESAMALLISASPAISGLGCHLHFAHSTHLGVNVKSPKSPLQPDEPTAHCNSHTDAPTAIATVTATGHSSSHSQPSAQVQVQTPLPSITLWPAALG